MDIQRLLQMRQQMTESGNSLSASLSLRAGDLLTASVLDVDKGSDALLSMGQFSAYARLPLPVVTGQDIQIRVEAAGDNLRLVMVPTSNQTTNVQSDEQLEIRLFEPISDRNLLAEYIRSLIPGEALQGRITGFEKNGQMLVDFGQFKAFAKIDIPVRQGQTIPLTVVKSDHGIALTVSQQAQPIGSINWPPDAAVDAMPKDQTGAIEPRSAATPARHAPQEMRSNRPAKSAAAMAGASPPPTAAEMAELRKQIQQMLYRTTRTGKAAPMSLSTPMKGALINLQQALSPASPTGDMTTLATRVREFVENSGIYFEKRLEQAIIDLQARSTSMPPAELARLPIIRDLIINDMKPNLLILKQFLDRQPLESQAADRHMLETLKSVVQRAVANIEQQQFMATEKPMDPDLFQAFSHLLFLTGTHHHTRLKVYYAKKGRSDDQKTPRVSLLLEMDRMGTVRTDLWMMGKDLNITFFVQDAGAKAAIESDQHGIGEMLSNTFNTVAVSVVVNQKKITEFEGDDLTLPDHRQVDLSI